MDLVRDFETDDSDSEPQQCFQTASMDRNAVRSVYLFTYSQANTEKFRKYEDFASAVVNSFASGTASLLQWCCSPEPHQIFLLQEEYVTKEDTEFKQSENHPRLSRVTQPRTNPASRRRHSRQNRSQSRGSRRNADYCDDEDSQDRSARTPRKKKRMSTFEFSEIITKEKIKNPTRSSSFSC